MVASKKNWWVRSMKIRTILQRRYDRVAADSVLFVLACRIGFVRSSLLSVQRCEYCRATYVVQLPCCVKRYREANACSKDCLVSLA